MSYVYNLKSNRDRLFRLNKNISLLLLLFYLTVICALIELTKASITEIIKEVEASLAPKVTLQRGKQ